MQAIQQLTQPLRKKLIFASTIDEENGVGNGTLLLLLAGVNAEAALYLDGCGVEIDVGCLGGSNLYLRPKDSISQVGIASDVALLTEACKAFSGRRAPLFEKKYFNHNLMKECSVQTVQRTDERGTFILIPFYTLPGEDDKAFCSGLEDAISTALGRRISVLQALPRAVVRACPCSHKNASRKTLASSVFDVLREEPSITTRSKQDSFILTNYAAIPTVAFGCTRRSQRTRKLPQSGRALRGKRVLGRVLCSVFHDL